MPFEHKLVVPAKTFYRSL